MADSEIERRAEQIRAQIDDLRASLETALRDSQRLAASATDWLGAIRGQVRTVAMGVSETVEGKRHAVGRIGLTWWMPIAAIVILGAAVLAVRWLRPSLEEIRDQMMSDQTAYGTDPTGSAWFDDGD
ncbi:MAG TPA: hypothetical protein VKY56_03205 [Chloroflexota bacterium]|nr:hypothetical protein [Chloroflexota bacterium]